jgi:hypothetical protein
MKKLITIVLIFVAFATAVETSCKESFASVPKKYYDMNNFGALVIGLIESHVNNTENVHCFKLKDHAGFVSLNSDRTEFFVYEPDSKSNMVIWVGACSPDDACVMETYDRYGILGLSKGMSMSQFDSFVNSWLKLSKYYTVEFKNNKEV